MTRKELATAIAKAQISRQNLTISVASFVHGLLYGRGYMRPYRKPELEKWYDSLVKDGYIA